VTNALRFAVVFVALVVNAILTRLLEMVSPLQSRIPPQNFGVPRKGGCLRGEKLRRTLWRYGASVYAGPVVFDSER